MRISGNTLLAAALSLALVKPSLSLASDKRAIEACEAKISEVYGVHKFRNVDADKQGHNKYRVDGKVKTHGHRYPFSCYVKHNRVKSYSYSGPHPNSHHDDDSKLGAALAVGAGLAIIAAVASQSRNQQITVDKNMLEDDCHDELTYRMRHEHGRNADVRIKSAEIRGHQLKGHGKVRWNRNRANRFDYVCHFSSHGNVVDSSYNLY